MEGGKRMKWGDESEVSDGEYLKSEEAEREEDHETDELVCGTKEEETAEEDGSDEDSDESEDQVVKMLCELIRDLRDPTRFVADRLITLSQHPRPHRPRRPRRCSLHFVSRRRNVRALLLENMDC